MYCSNACKVRAYRERHKVEEEPPRFPAPVQAAVPPAKVRLEILEVVDVLFERDETAPPADQLARLIIEVRTIAHHAGRLESVLPPQLAWRAFGLAEQLTDALARYFPLEGVGRG